MPSAPPTLYPTATTSLPGRPYILSLTPHLTSTSSHLLLSHPSPEITIIDAQTFQLVDKLKGGHSKDISCVVTSTSASTDELVQGGFANEGNIWSAGTDANVVRWDERSRRPGQTIKGKEQCHSQFFHIAMSSVLTLDLLPPSFQLGFEVEVSLSSPWPYTKPPTSSSQGPKSSPPNPTSSSTTPDHPPTPSTPTVPPIVMISPRSPSSPLQRHTLPLSPPRPRLLCLRRGCCSSRAQRMAC